MHSLNSSPRTRRMTLLSGIVATGVVLAGGAAYAVPTSGTPTVEAPAAVDEGDTFTVTVSLPATTDVFAYSATLAFDAALVAYVDDSAVGPDGGFAATSTTADAVVFTDTRLGTSPALAGDLVLFSADFIALAGGTAPFDLDELTLVGADTEELVVDADVSVETDITPEDNGTGGTPTPEPSVDPSVDPSPEPTLSPSAEPTAEPSPEPSDAVGDGVSVDGPGADGLSNTGASPFGLIIAAAIAIALGITLVVRKTVMSR